MLHDKLKNYFEEQKEEYLKIFTDLVSIDTQTIEQGIGGGKVKNSTVATESPSGRSKP